MDICVTIPKSFGLQQWIDEGDPAGAPEWSGHEWHFFLGGSRPTIEPGERVYVVFNGTLRGAMRPWCASSPLAHPTRSCATVARSP